MQVDSALNLLSLSLCLSKGGQQKRRQKSEDRHNREKFNHGECRRAFNPCFLSDALPLAVYAHKALWQQYSSQSLLLYSIVVLHSGSARSSAGCCCTLEPF